MIQCLRAFWSIGTYPIQTLLTKNCFCIWICTCYCYYHGNQLNYHFILHKALVFDTLIDTYRHIWTYEYTSCTQFAIVIWRRHEEHLWCRWHTVVGEEMGPSFATTQNCFVLNCIYALHLIQKVVFLSIFSFISGSSMIFSPLYKIFRIIWPKGNNFFHLCYCYCML